MTRLGVTRLAVHPPEGRVPCPRNFCLLDVNAHLLPVRESRTRYHLDPLNEVRVSIFIVTYCANYMIIINILNAQ